MESLFEVNLMNQRGKDKAHAIAEAFSQLLATLRPLCGNGREMAIVKTKLEEASMFAKKAMSLQVENQSRGSGEQTKPAE
jgi:hypothetical protein